MDDRFFLGEDDFRTWMDTEGKAFREAHYLEGNFPGCDFRNIHYTQIIHPDEKAAIVISHGFCEFIRKFDEAIYYFYQMGYSVYFIEHRGHGFSYRSVEELDKVDVERFYDYVDDLNCFIDMVVKRNSPGKPLFLYSHSMGGAIGAAYLEEYPSVFDAAILSSPMMEMTLGKYPRWAVSLLALWKKFRKKGTDFIVGSHGFDGVDVFESSSALSRARYEYAFDARKEVKNYSTYGGTYNWIDTSLRAEKKIIRNAAKIKVPVLLFQAGLDAKVQPEGQERFAAKNPLVKISRYPDSKHEIMNATTEIREKYYREVFAFYEMQLNQLLWVKE
ncbi:MAG: alpha/beta hydrolase [Lachnospiraceae bacterium]|nr:alpha/beta hydrolase [Lachnospiraceae bacterium]